MTLLIKNGTLVDPKNNINEKKDVFVKDGKISIIEKGINEKTDEVIDASGLVIAPGFIDMHVHLREPGREDKETILTCSRAAARGGITTIVGMPNTTPVGDDQTVIKYVVSIAEKEAVVNVFPVGNITKGGNGEELSQIGDLIRAGAIAVSDDGVSVKNAGVMRKAMQYLKKFNVPLINHSEDPNIAGNWAMHEGKISTMLGLPAKPASAEEAVIAREIVLSEDTGYPIHFTHVNSIGAIKMIKLAKERGLKVTADTCPHYFTLTDEAVLGYNPMAKMNPPLRPKEHVDAVIEGLKNGSIDCISTDHAPHLKVDKYFEFEECENGIVGLETSVGLGLDRLVNKNILDISKYVEKMSVNPAKILGLKNKGHLSLGADADITIIDPAKQETVDVEKFESKGINTPFNGWKLKGAAVYTIVKGKIVMKEGKVL